MTSVVHSRPTKQISSEGGANCNPGGEHNVPQSRTAYLFLLCLTAGAGYGCYLLIAPFLKSVLLAMVFAVLAYPIYARIHRRVRNSTVASLLATCVVALFALTVFALLTRTLAASIHETYDSLNANGDGRERLGIYVLGLADRAAEVAAKHLPVSTADLHQAVTIQLQKGPELFVREAAAGVKGMASGVVNAFICVFALFFVFRDGRRIVRQAFVLLPLRPNYLRMLLARIKDTLRAVVYGTLTIALLQGLLTGLSFWALGVTSPVLWATVTSVCALIPVVGTGFVLAPAITMLVANGHWMKGLILLGWGLAVVHPVDNLLRPYLIGERTQLSTLCVFFSLLGGVQAFGAIGVFAGPVILASALTLFHFVREEARRLPTINQLRQS